MIAEAEETKQESEEESMEDILHSIRDIIADGPDNEGEEERPEDAEGEKPEDAEGDQKDGDAEEDVLELTDIIEPVEAESAEGDDISAKKDEVGTPTEGLDEDPTDILNDIDEALDEQDDLGQKVDESFDSVSKQSVEEEAVPEESQGKVVDSQEESLISDNIAEQAGSAIKNLMNTLPKNDIDSPHTRSGTSLEDLVIEAIRPMLSEWLDTNLNGMVERIVKHEIKKLIKEKIDE